MKLLLDTHLLLWTAAEPAKIPKKARSLILENDNELFFSAASIWEIAIKSRLGRADFDIDAHVLRRGLTDNGYLELAINAEHALAVLALPPLHKDPFDRMLVAQATVEGFVLLTTDEQVAAYPGPIRKS
ncbi:MAG TPA: type II toxin-antitoxin system VapC family toxin [Sphingomicrobium sp.]|nr:type II toxin-antitoxin system VapC family toxin [Sphingomicrobium sp.]